MGARAFSVASHVSQPCEISVLIHQSGRFPAFQQTHLFQLLFQEHFLLKKKTHKTRLAKKLCKKNFSRRILRPIKHKSSKTFQHFSQSWAGNSKFAKYRLPQYDVTVACFDAVTRSLAHMPYAVSNPIAKVATQPLQAPRFTHHVKYNPRDCPCVISDDKTASR